MDKYSEVKVQLYETFTSTQYGGDFSVLRAKTCKLALLVLLDIGTGKP
jgi:hypothetical protein